MKRWWLAFGLSFAVYLLPIAGPHAAWLLGEVHVQDWSSASDKPVAWRLADLSVALALQGVAFGILLWALARPRRLVVFLLVLPAMEVFVLATYLLVIPSRFLIEPDTAPELNTLAEHCAVPQASLAAVRGPADLPSLTVREWWLQFPDARYGLMRAADCSVTMATWPQPVVQPGGRVDFLIGVVSYVPGAGTIVERQEPATGARTWWLAERPDAPLRPLLAPDGQETPPMLSSDGTAVVWHRVVRESDPPVRSRLVVRPVADAARETVVDLSPFGPASYSLAAFDAASRTVTIWRNEELTVVTLDGAVSSTLTADQVRPQPGTFLIRPPDATVAWDAYQERDPYRITWSTARGRGSYTLPKGRSFADAALEPSRGLVAFSATTTLSIGDTADLLAIVNAADGRDVYRRYLARYSRSPTVFFDGGLFGYSDLTGAHVVRLP